MVPTLVIVGGVMQGAGYALTALDLRRTRRRLRSSLLPHPGYHAVDFSRVSDSATSRPPTVEERLAAVEAAVAAVTRRFQEREDEAVAQRLRDQATAAEQARRPLLDFLDREPMQRASVALFVLGVTASVIGSVA